MVGLPPKSESHADVKPLPGNVVKRNPGSSAPVKRQTSQPRSCASTPFSERDSYLSTALTEVMDRSSNAMIAKVTKGLSPSSLTSAYLDWLTHIIAAPGKRMQLGEKAANKWMRLMRLMLQCAASAGDGQPCIEPLEQDRRFRSKEWQQWPFNALYQSHLLAQQWWHVATTGVPGVTAQHERVLEFSARQILDVFAPSNFVLTNPEIIAKAHKEGGQNFVRGFQNLLEDWERTARDKPAFGVENFRPGQDVAATPGKIVFKNALMELIQYEPTTDKVQAEPILITPAWIMKYYILDLSPHNSLISYLVGQGFTVFVISWKNPDPEDRDLGMDDYQNLGIMAALDAISKIVPERKVHGVGYCLGGTLLAIVAAALARDGNSPFQSLSFLAAQVDFEEPGELQLFIDESQLRFLEDMMWEQGFLEARQMSGAFQLLHSNDLIWSHRMKTYLMGDRDPMTDMMAWNADSTRLPFRMHSEYLRRLYLNNDLAEGRFEVDGQPIVISDIRAPVFCVGTQTDHVAPWRSVYKWNRMADTDITFLLASGGHNGGIVSEPGRPHRSYQVASANKDDLYVDPETWAAHTPVKEGSWWTEWVQWLGGHSSARTALPGMAAPDEGLPVLGDAPGTYIHMK